MEKRTALTPWASSGRITSLKDLPPKRVLLVYVKKAKQLNDNGVKAPRAKPQGGKKELTVPDYFTAMLKKNKKALATFEAFPYSKKTWNGSPKPKQMKPASAACKLRLNGWRRESRTIGNMNDVRKGKGPAPSTILA